MAERLGRPELVGADKGFEIYSVSLDDKRDAWTKAISELELPWVHVSSLKGWDCPELVEAVSGESARPELAWIDAQQERLAAQELSVKSATRPRFGVFAQGYYGYPGLDYFAGMVSTDWTWNALIGVKMSWNFGAYYTKKNRLSNLRVAQQQLDIQRDVFLFNTDLQVAEEQGNISRLRRALADDDRIVALRRSVREAAESKLRNGVIDTNDLLRKITDEASARSARSLREVELLKAIYELKYTINR